MSKEKLRIILVYIFGITIPFILGILFHDYYLGPITLACGFLNSYYMAIGKWQNYVFGLIFSVTYGLACFYNGLYGMVIFTVLIYTPLQIFGIINWIRHKKEKQVEMKSLNFKKSMLLCGICISGSILLGFLLSLIPTQNLAFLDSTSQIVNVCGVVLVAMRYREAWYVWLLNNIVDLVIWIINAAGGTANSGMMLITSVMYLIMNIFGIVAWIRIENRQKLQKLE